MSIPSGPVLLARHYLEMVVGMMLAMAVLGAARDAVGLSVPVTDHPTAGYLLMAVDMSIGMAVVMRWRGHRWSHVAEMCGAMVAPALLLPSLDAVLGAGTVMVLAHVAMFVLMLAVMLLRRDVYAGHRAAPRQVTSAR